MHEKNKKNEAFFVAAWPYGRLSTSGCRRGRLANVGRLAG